MTPDDLVGSYLYGIFYQMHVDELGVQFDKCDEDDLRAIGAMSTLGYRMASKAETPVDCSFSRLCVLTAAILLAKRGTEGARVAAEWRTALDEYIAIQQSAGKWTE
ncbi:MAG: hypothetical protein VX424_23660 [Actinomycetota bacterium]|nr:hypothetical protein [Actinomycetota bacterium]